jgi:hypothetical protein
MQTSKWGPSGWKYLHSIAHNYNPNVHNKKDYKDFFRLVGKTLPCKYCRESFEKFSKELPIDNYLNSQENMAYWMYLIHNKVNNKFYSPFFKDLSFDYNYLKL